MITFNYMYIIIMSTCMHLQWNLRREDKLGPGVLSFIERLSSLRGYDQSAIFHTQNHIAGCCDYQKSIIRLCNLRTTTMY